MSSIFNSQFSIPRCRRRFLTPEVCRKWRVGYCTRDSGGVHAGGTMRGKNVYGYQSDPGELLIWFGRDPEFEEKHQRWAASDKTEREPEKFHFVKGFQRGIELSDSTHYATTACERNSRVCVC